MVGGRIVGIEDLGGGVFEFTVVGTGCEKNDVVKVRVLNPERLPDLYTSCWWQSGKVYCERDTLVLNKYANSYSGGRKIRAVN